MVLVRIDPTVVRMGMIVHGFDGRPPEDCGARETFVIETPEQLASVRESGADAVLIEEQREPQPARVLPPKARPAPVPLPMGAAHIGHGQGLRLVR